MTAFSPESKARSAECFARAQELSNGNDYDYAHTLLADCVLHDPPNLCYVESLLKNLQRKFPRPPKKLFGLGRSGSRELKNAVSQQQWLNALRIGLDLLKSNPWDVTTLRTLAEISGKQHHNEVELAYLKQALDAAPKDLEVNRHCARSLARMGQFDQAIACWHRIEILRPGDKEAAKMIAHLAEEKLRYADGRPAATLASTPNATATISEDIENADISLVDIPSSPRLQLERAIADDPYDISNYLELADLYLASNDLREAEGILNRGIGTCGSHSSLETRLLRVQDLLAKQAAEIERMREREISRRKAHFRMPWLEVGLLLSGIALALQFFPAAGTATLRGIDFRSWPRTNWIYAILAAISALSLIRLSPMGIMPKRLFAISWLVPIVLFVQVIPAARGFTWRVIDVSQWTNGNWVAGIAILLTTLLAIRFGPIILRSKEKRLSGLQRVKQ